MQKRRRTLSIDDQKAIDLVLDLTVAARNGVTRAVAPVAQHRLTAATKWLSLLAELPKIDPPVGLAERTIKMIDGHNGHNGKRLEHSTSAAIPASTHIH